jgi:hypothetical protein
LSKGSTAKISLNQGLEPIKLADRQPAERLDELGMRAEALFNGAGSDWLALLGPSLWAEEAGITRVMHRHLIPPFRDTRKKRQDENIYQSAQSAAHMAERESKE